VYQGRQVHVADGPSGSSSARTTRDARRPSLRRRERRASCIARLMLQPADLLFLDEPTERPGHSHPRGARDALSEPGRPRPGHARPIPARPRVHVHPRPQPPRRQGRPVRRHAQWGTEQDAAPSARGRGPQAGGPGRPRAKGACRSARAQMGADGGRHPGRGAHGRGRARPRIPRSPPAAALHTRYTEAGGRAALRRAPLCALGRTESKAGPAR
jgi:hypothetical protein